MHRIWVENTQGFHTPTDLGGDYGVTKDPEGVLMSLVIPK